MEILQAATLMFEFLKLNKADPATVKEVQQQRFRRLLHHAATHSPFYRERFRGVDLDGCSITDLPIVTKKQMMDHFDDCVTDRRLNKADVTRWLQNADNHGKMFKDRFIPFMTSGTTGESSIVVYDRAAMNHIHAAVFGKHAMPTQLSTWESISHLLRVLSVRKIRWATIIATGAPHPTFTSALCGPRLQSLFVNQKIISVMDPIEEIVEKLNAFQPHIVISYPSILGLLAREQLAGHLRLDFGKHPLSRICTGSEPLSDETKALATKAWGAGVQDHYGAGECLVMARSCGQFDRMHVAADLCILEVVDRDYRPVPAGRLGEKVLVTNLFNYAQPFIRYELSDVTGYSDQPCKCGLPFPTLMKVEGRTDDIFYIRRANGGYEPVHPYVFQGPVWELGQVRQFQVAQIRRNKFMLSYVTDNGHKLQGDRVQKKIQQALAKASLAGKIDLELQRVDAIPRDVRSGKFREFISVVGAPGDLISP